MRILDSKKKEEAVRLRKAGMLYREINQKTGVAMSTLSTWLVDVQVEGLTSYEANLGDAVNSRANSIRLAHSNNRRKKFDRAEKFFSNVELNYDSLALVGAAIYWAEGARYGGVRFANSDPDLILLYMRWLREVLKVREQDLVCRINVHVNNGITIEQITEYWSDLVHVPGAQFYRPAVNELPKSSKGKRKSKHPYGVLTVGLRHPVLYRSALAALLPKLGKNTNYVAMSPSVPTGQY